MSNVINNYYLNICRYPNIYIITGKEHLNIFFNSKTKYTVAKSDVWTKKNQHSCPLFKHIIKNVLNILNILHMVFQLFPLRIRNMPNCADITFGQAAIQSLHLFCGLW